MEFDYTANKFETLRSAVNTAPCWLVSLVCDEFFVWFVVISIIDKDLMSHIARFYKRIMRKSL